jgi:SAM-dependent methyltransferase
MGAVTDGWTNESVIRMWGGYPVGALTETADDGGLAKRLLLNEHLLRLAGDIAGRLVLDAGCGNGYLARMLARAGARVVGVEPGESLYVFATGQEVREPLGVEYLQADLSTLPEPNEPFDVVIASMVLPVIPDWQAAMRRCVEVLRPGGTFIFSINHPAFESLFAMWSEFGEYRTRQYLQEHTISGAHGPDFHRPLSAYLNEVARLGCSITEVVEPGLDPRHVLAGPEGIEAYVQLPNFMIVAATRG